MSRKGPEVGKGMLDFLEDIFVDILVLALAMQHGVLLMIIT